MAALIAPLGAPGKTAAIKGFAEPIALRRVPALGEG